MSPTSSTNSFKSAYAGLWKTATERDTRIRDAVSAGLGIELVPNGFAAGSVEWVEGYAKDHGMQRGGADHATPCGKLHLEATGTDYNLKPRDALWVRPDKVDAARDTLAAGTLTVIGHEAPVDGRRMIRFIVCDAAFLDRAAAFRTIRCSPHGVSERFLAVPGEDAAVMTGERAYPAMLSWLASDAPTSLPAPLPMPARPKLAPIVLFARRKPLAPPPQTAIAKTARFSLWRNTRAAA